MKSLLSFKGAWPYLIAVFLNAAVDLGHKIILQNSLFKLYEGPEQVALTALVNALILLPFILLLSPAGFISDRFAKSKVLRFTAWMAVGLTCLITCFYYLGWFWLAFAAPNHHAPHGAGAGHWRGGRAVGDLPCRSFSLSGV